MVYSFLLEIRELYQKNPSNFNPTLKSAVIKFNTDEGDSITKARRNISEVNQIMLENLEKVIERGIKIEVMEQKTESLEERAIQFRSESSRLKRKMCWQSYKWTLIIVGVTIIVLIVIGLIIWASVS
jgi:vesicle-associated membrane protein 7